MRRKALLALFAGAAFLCLYLALRPAAFTPHLYTKDYEQIEKGMSEAQVCAILGGPPGNYADRYVRPMCEPRPRPGTHKRWGGRVYVIDVWLEDGIVIDKAIDFATGEETYSEKIRRWLWS